MKSLGTLFFVAVLAVPIIGASTPAYELANDDVVREALAIHNGHTGQAIAPGDLRVVAREDFVLPAGALGIEAVANLATGVITVTPISALPDTSAESGCLVVSQFQGFGYTQSPLGIGDSVSGCNFMGTNTHLGGPSTSSIACLNSQYCYTIASGTGGFTQLYCQFNTVTVAQADWTTGSGSTLGNGVCSLFSFLFQPIAAWASHYGYTNHFPPSPALATINY